MGSRRLKSSFLFIFLSFLLSCGNEDHPTNSSGDETTQGTALREVPYRVIDDSDFSARPGPPHEGVFHQQEHFKNFFVSRFNLNPSISVDEIPIDFPREMAVVLLLGDRPTSGYSISILQILESSDDLTIYYQEIVPGDSCQVAQVFTYPSLLIALPASPKDILFERRVGYRACD